MDRILNRRRPWPWIAALGMAVLLGACSPAAGDDSGRSGNGEPPATGSASELPPVPEGAIRVDEDSYMIPLGADENGCEMFRAFSQAKFVVQAIFYRTASGGFTMDRGESACSG